MDSQNVSLYGIQNKQDVLRRLRGRCKHKLVMCSNNHSLFSLTNKPVAVRFLLTLKLQQDGQFER